MYVRKSIVYQVKWETGKPENLKETTIFKVKKPLWKRILRWFVILLLASLVYSVLCLWLMPPITFTQVSNSFAYGLKRDYVSWNQISPNVKLAAMASEDQLFVDHNGFDWKSLEKSLEGKHGKKQKTRGTAASTISQQTAKNVFLWQGGGVFKYLRKAPEFFYTAVIELLWSKQRIMEVYLNVIEMGPGIFGIEAASRHYFKKPAKSLSRQEAAMIIGCLPNPKKYKVKPPSRFVQWKSNWIMRQMNVIEGDPDVRSFIKSK